MEKYNVVDIISNGVDSALFILGEFDTKEKAADFANKKGYEKQKELYLLTEKETTELIKTLRINHVYKPKK
jgi:hypothetical protein